MALSIVDGLRAVTGRAPHAPALSWRGTVWSYAELDRAIAAVRDALDARGVPRGARVALLLRSSLQYVAAFYGALAAGCVAVPLNAHERSSVLTRQIGHCGAAMLIGDPGHPEWAALEAALPSGVTVISITAQEGEGAARRLQQDLGDAASVARSGARADPVELGSNDLAAIVYTSGTTGQPKGVMQSHGNLHANACAIIDYLELNATDRGLCVLPLHFSYGSSVLHSHLLSGALLVLEDNFAFPHLALQRIQDDAITGFAGVPSTYSLLLARCRLADFDLSSLRYVTQAGGAMPAPLTARVREAFAPARLFVMYGQTEATARLTFLPPERLDDKPGSVGVPVRGVELDIRVEGRTVPAGTTGEIHARGPNVMLGYWADPAATAGTLSGGWLATGDLGHRDEDGYLYIDGRASEMIKAGAHRISPREIEEVISALDEVEEVAVTGIEDELLGQAVKAVVVTKPGACLEVRAVKAHCRQQLAAYKVPKVVEFSAALPRTASGKVKRFELS